MAGTGTKRINPTQLEELYAETKNFEKKLGSAFEGIDNEMTKLTSPALLDGLSGGQGDQAVEAIKEVAEVMKKFKEDASRVCKFIDGKLEASMKLRQDRHGFEDKKSQAKAAAEKGNMTKQAH